MSEAQVEFTALKITIDTTSSLIDQLLEATKATISFNETEKQDSKLDVNVLELAHDAASHIKAHSTKLSLLIINEPFTPTAICTVLQELASGPLPALTSAVELCDASSYTSVVKSELKWRVEKVFTEFAVLIKAIPLNGKALSRDQKNGIGVAIRKGSLVSTGVVWKSCDTLMELRTLGVVGVLVQKAEQYRDTLRDALEELREWGEETSEDEDEANGIDMESSSAQAIADSIFNYQRHIPRDDTNKVRERLEASVRRLKLVTMMYQAIVKRRFKTLPALPHPDILRSIANKSSNGPGIVQTLNEVMGVLKKIPDIADELANAFYELDNEEIDKRMDECFFTSFAATEILGLNWDGQRDEFTAWASKFQIAMKRDSLITRQ